MIEAVTKKELRPFHDNVACDVCGRTMLKGERTESYLAPGGQRHRVCELCFARAEHHGWIRESAAGELPARVPRDEPRRPLLGRLRRRQPSRDAAEGATPELPFPAGPDEPEPVAPDHASDGAAPPEEALPGPEEAPQPARPRSRPKDPRHVRAVPTTAEVKVERALELFNDSDHHRTVAGLSRTLGAPWVAAMPDLDQPSAVTLAVAWELSWYVFRVDLGDEGSPVVLLEKGEELEDMDESLRDWNATIDADGRLVAEAVSTRGGSQG